MAEELRLLDIPEPHELEISLLDGALLVDPNLVLSAAKDLSVNSHLGLLLPARIATHVAPA